MLPPIINYFGIAAESSWSWGNSIAVLALFFAMLSAIAAIISANQARKSNEISCKLQIEARRPWLGLDVNANNFVENQSNSVVTVKFVFKNVGLNPLHNLSAKISLFNEYGTFIESFDFELYNSISPGETFTMLANDFKKDIDKKRHLYLICFSPYIDSITGIKLEPAQLNC